MKSVGPSVESDLRDKKAESEPMKIGDLVDTFIVIKSNCVRVVKELERVLAILTNLVNIVKQKRVHYKLSV